MHPSLSGTPNTQLVLIDFKLLKLKVKYRQSRHVKDNNSPSHISHLYTEILQYCHVTQQQQVRMRGKIMAWNNYFLKRIRSVKTQTSSLHGLSGYLNYIFPLRRPSYMPVLGSTSFSVRLAGTTTTHHSLFVPFARSEQLVDNSMLVIWKCKPLQLQGKCNLRFNSTSILLRLPLWPKLLKELQKY